MTFGSSATNRKLELILIELETIRLLLEELVDREKGNDNT